MGIGQQNMQSSLRDVMTELYSIISGPPGPRDWARAEILYHPSAVMVRANSATTAQAGSRVFSLDEYTQETQEMLSRGTFYETEIGHKAYVFGDVAQIISVYEACLENADCIRSWRGVNMIQCLRQNDCWKIVNIMWDVERPGHEISPDMLNIISEDTAPLKSQAGA